ncbi:DedA family protein [Cognatishimia sp. SS12]|uniref:DedA family protein n=1 Tax=Cognatishimia sp. SS12 TaxID=2979465 RepID=UPI00232F8BE8|nr:DedA family protein [Cognatishimia sp. SS12]MDC0737361.1 DedA family protein [Cognatishimia sp. SS12]
MSEALISALATYGSALLFITTLLSCLALPVPSSLLMLSAGAFVATGDLALSTVGLAALAGAICGDQLGYVLGARGRGALVSFMNRTKPRARMMARAEAYLHKWGGLGVFLSRWLFSPLGPYINFAGGAAHMSHWRFSLFSVLGEIVWVGFYVGLGYLFADNLAMASELAGDMLGVLAGLSLMFGFGFWLYHHHRKKQATVTAN